jgi:S-adenosyl methyltransferase
MQPTIDTTKPHSARMYDYYLGGKDNFEADRKTAEALLHMVPTVRTAARENRAFLGRAVRYLVTRAGIRQFLDIGTGLPSANNVHDVAQQAAPQTRVVYVDNDPIVLSHARALLTSTPEGRTAYIHADLRDPEKILRDPVTTDVLDFGQPIALMLVGVLHFVPDDDKPAGIVSALLSALPVGSYLVASHSTHEYTPEIAQTVADVYRRQGVPFQFRTGDEFAALAFGDLDMVEPGVVSVPDWHPDSEELRPLPNEVAWNGGVARKPAPGRVMGLAPAQ